MNLVKRMIFPLVLLVGTLSLANEQKYASLGDLNCELGGVLKDCVVGYRTLGELNEDSSNVIIYPTWFGGKSETILKLLKPNKLIDPEGYYFVIFDALGNGVSSSPSNYEGEFPEITVGDMVKAEYQVITEELGLKKIYGAIGGSMGSMQIFEWMRAYPGFIEKAVPYVCTPQPSVFDRMTWELRKTIIEDYWKFKAADEEIWKKLNLINLLQCRTPEYYVENVEQSELISYLNEELVKNGPLFTVENYYAQVVAMTHHDIFRNDASFEEGAEKIKTKLLMIVVNSDHLVNPSVALKLGKATDSEVFILNNNRGHLGVGYDIDKCRKKIEEFF